MTFIKHFINIVPSTQKNENLIYVFNEQLFVSILLKNIVQPIL